MNTKLFLLYPVFLALLVFSTVSTSVGTIVTFDDLSETGTGSFLASGYQGLVWSNFEALNTILFTDQQAIHLTANGSNGYYNGMVSASNVAFNAFGDPAEIDSSGTNFNFLSAYLTGAWNSNLSIEVQGFTGTTLLYDTTVVASATSPTLFTFNYHNINRLYLISSGGQQAFGIAGGNNFVMDKFTFEFVPEPSSFLLATAGALLLCPLLKRKRV
ncbi:MAG TPA: PEP-CTERM sorting domain-containing protein [Verrucomicrobiae bacterium]|nr:PEP-CTERM sorting domain-containing protein [Verrucomicrobiae bacterium]